MGPVSPLSGIPVHSGFGPSAPNMADIPYAVAVNDNIPPVAPVPQASFLGGSGGTYSSVPPNVNPYHVQGDFTCVCLCCVVLCCVVLCCVIFCMIVHFILKLILCFLCITCNKICWFFLLKYVRLFFVSESVSNTGGSCVFGSNSCHI